MKTTFSELPIGARFCFRARRYEKVAAEIGRDEDRGGNVFHASTEVILEMQSVERKVNNGAKAAESGASAGKHAAQVEGLKPAVARSAVGPAPGTHWIRGGQPVARPLTVFSRVRERQVGRLGRRPDRELRAYGTI